MLTMTKDGRELMVDKFHVDLYKRMGWVEKSAPKEKKAPVEEPEEVAEEVPEEKPKAPKKDNSKGKRRTIPVKRS
jgi:hypothetical protein